MHVDHTTVQWSLNLLGESVMHIADAHKHEGKSCIEVHHEVLGACLVFTNLRSKSSISAEDSPNSMLEIGEYEYTFTYAIGRAIAHLLREGSPNARICLTGPSSSLTLESALI